MTDSTNSAALSQPLYGASLGQAVGRFFKKYATFSGRASRSEYWWAVLFLAIANTIFSILFSVLGGSFSTANGTTVLSGGALVVVILWGIFGLAVIVPGIAVAVRRLHDANFSGWFYLFSVVGLAIVVFILALLESKPEGARFDK